MTPILLLTAAILHSRYFTQSQYEQLTLLLQLSSTSCEPEYKNWKQDEKFSQRNDGSTVNDAKPTSNFCWKKIIKYKFIFHYNTVKQISDSLKKKRNNIKFWKIGSTSRKGNLPRRSTNDGL